MGTESVDHLSSSVSMVLDHLTTYSLDAVAEVDGLEDSVNVREGGGGGGGGGSATANASNGGSSLAHTADRDFCFPGFLTDTKLISLEFQDPVFRRQILVLLIFYINAMICMI